MRPVGKPRLHLSNIQCAAFGVQDVEFVAIDQCRGRYPRHVLAGGENDLDVGTVSHQQRLELRRIIELDFDVDRARLFLPIKHVRSDPPNVATELLPGKGVNADPPRLPDDDFWRVDLVHGRGYIEAGVIDQIHRRRCRNARWGRGGELTDFARDFGNDAGERSAQIGGREFGAYRGNLRVGLPYIGISGTASGFPGLRLGS